MLIFIRYILLFSIFFFPYYLHSENAVRSTDVLLIDLIKDQGKYDGKYIHVIGYVSIGLENMSICTSPRVDAMEGCLWLNFGGEDVDSEESMVDYSRKIELIKMKFDAKRVELEGVFKMGRSGHLGMWPGDIVNITNMKVID